MSIKVKLFEDITFSRDEIIGYCQELSNNTPVYPILKDSIFKLRDYQKKMVKTITENRYTILLASRQIGKCCHVDSNITIKNKVTNKIETISIGDFYKRMNLTKEN